jgi:hypothetical protein
VFDPRQWLKPVFSMDERKTNLMHLLHIFIVAVGDALHVSGVFAYRQERYKTKSVA